MRITREKSGFIPPALTSAASAYPQPTASGTQQLPRLFPVIAFCGPRGSGKTYTAVQLLRAYEEGKITEPKTGERTQLFTYLYTPTYDANPILRSLKSMCAVEEKWDSKRFSAIVEEMNERIAAWKQYQAQMRSLKRAAAGKARQIDLFQLQSLEEEPEHVPPPIHCLFVDDMLGSKLLAPGSEFSQFLIKNRHHRCMVFILSQSVKGIPKTVRANVSCWGTCRFGNAAVIDDLHEEVSNLPRETFEALYEEGTRGEHDMLVIDFSQPKDRRFSCSFREVLHVEK